MYKLATQHDGVAVGALLVSLIVKEIMKLPFWKTLRYADGFQ